MKWSTEAVEGVRVTSSRATVALASLPSWLEYSRLAMARELLHRLELSMRSSKNKSATWEKGVNADCCFCFSSLGRCFSSVKNNHPLIRPCHFLWHVATHRFEKKSSKKGEQGIL